MQRREVREKRELRERELVLACQTSWTLGPLVLAYQRGGDYRCRWSGRELREREKNKLRTEKKKTERRKNWEK
uniref:Uncharacterized protein n=1 Tax=Nelumbo nucifera TaxID=4432 RepID=A0A822YN32_NELNU|nr:TPA_asm: hypothetical protein HUJ06_004650 [Nelumbo nucifera]